MFLSKAKAGMDLYNSSNWHPSRVATSKSMRLSSAPESIRACRGSTVCPHITEQRTIRRDKLGDVTASAEGLIRTPNLIDEPPLLAEMGSGHQVPLCATVQALTGHLHSFGDSLALPGSMGSSSGEAEAGGAGVSDWAGEGDGDHLLGADSHVDEVACLWGHRSCSRLSRRMAKDTREETLEGSSLAASSSLSCSEKAFKNIALKAASPQFASAAKIQNSTA